MKIFEFCEAIRPFFFISEHQPNFPGKNCDFSKIVIESNKLNSHNLNLSFHTRAQVGEYTFKKSFGFKKEELYIIRVFIEMLNDFLQTNIDSIVDIKTVFPILHTKSISKFLSYCSYDEAGQFYSLQSPRNGVENIAYSIISKYLDWSTQTYEGNRISHAIGVILDYNVRIQENESHEINICNYLDEDYTKVLTTGNDTIMACNMLGDLVNHIEIEDIGIKTTYAPYQFDFFAQWASLSKIIFALNRNGEILIFFHNRLYFARRRNCWIFLPHKQLKNQIYPFSTEQNAAQVSQAIYESTLDLAFRRTGGCIGIVNDAQSCINPNNALGNAEDKKQQLYNKIVDGRKFQELPRKLRLELLSLDGATVILRDGTVLAVGSILNISDCYTTCGDKTAQCNLPHGGRESAAMNLSLNGNIGIKISNDGKVTAYKNAIKIIEYA